MAIAQRVLGDWLAAKSPLTLRAYRGDLADFASFIGAPTSAHAAATLLGQGHAAANHLAIAYKDALLRARRSAATINRRLAALRSLVKVARLVGAVTWTLEIAAVPSQPYRDTRGPGADGFAQLLAVVDRAAEPHRSRDALLLWLLYGRALRVGEACRVRFPDDVAPPDRLRITGKHRYEPEWVTLPPAAVRALEAWLRVRGRDAGPLFTRLDAAWFRVPEPKPLTTGAVWRLLRRLAARAGLPPVRPHGLRHAAITTALDATRGDVRATQRFARLRSAAVLRYYDDNREDLGGQVAAAIAP